MGQRFARALVDERQSGLQGPPGSPFAPSAACASGSRIRHCWPVAFSTPRAAHAWRTALNVCAVTAAATNAAYRQARQHYGAASTLARR